jgi:solute:Na+ symporter, SSS family
VYHRHVRELHTVDWGIITAYVLLALALGIFFTRRASASVEQFFISGRSLPWWLAGTSMAATNFSIDTPIAISGLVAKEGVAGVWFFWSSGIAAMLATFFFARLWRRAKVITDAEIIELRYSGRPAAALRVFKGLYFGVLINCFVMGWVMTAMMKVMGEVTSLDRLTILIVFTVIALVYTLLSGFWGVVVTDLVQYVVALGGSIAVAFYSVRAAGGLTEMRDKLTERFGAEAGVTDFVPSFSGGAEDGGQGWMAPSVFIAYVAVQWWAHKYADGGGKTIQRMSAARDEKQAVLATLWFGLANYALQVWPWILTALAALATLGQLPDPEAAYPRMLLLHLPHGLMGLAVVALLGAFMSTVDTHLNLGASYMVNDLYRRFLVKGASERHYVQASRVSMLLNMGVACLVGWQIESVGAAWKFVLAFSAGAGPTYIARWFWWRASAWTELSAMLASAVIATVLQLGHPDLLYSWRLMIVVGGSALIWIPVTLLTPATEPERLAAFLRRVRAGSPGWRAVAQRHNVETEPYLRHAALRWLAGCGVLFGLCFGLGGLLLGQPLLGGALMLGAALLLVGLLRSIK